MKSTWISILMLFSGVAVFGQFDSTTWGPNKWKPSLIRPGLNVLRLVESVAAESNTSAEGMVEVNFHKYFLVAEFGVGQSQRGEAFDYKSQGYYYRIGIDKNVIPFNKDRDVISVGFRYAISSFDDMMSFETYRFDDIIAFDAGNKDAQARWIEINIGMRTHLWKNLMIGYQFRGKVFKKLTNSGDLEPFDIPGFGRNKKGGEVVKTSAVGFDYFLYWTIPFRDKHIPPNPKKF